jgi:hypothetical protein
VRGPAGDADRSLDGQGPADKATTAKAANLDAKRTALLERKDAAAAKAGAREIGEAAEATRQRRRAGSR